jgi:tRNA(Ile)-lysidine synthase
MRTVARTSRAPSPRAVEIAVRRAIDELIPERATVVAAVSGGGDSVALVHLLERFRRSRSIALSVAHLDHGMRSGSDADRRFVEELARGLGLPCVSDRRDVGSLRRAGESAQEAARRVRRSFLVEAATAQGADLVATGHTLDDQAETILLRLARGGGSRSMVGMAVRGPGPFVRPLLAVERAGLRAWLARRRLDHVEDPSNGDDTYDRNRLRRLVVPLLARELNPRAARHVVDCARTVRDDVALVDGLARERFDRIAVRDGRGRVSLDARALDALPPPLSRRVALLALEAAGADLRRVCRAHLDRLCGLASGSGRRLDLPGRLRARRAGVRIVVEAGDPAA